MWSAIKKHFCRYVVTRMTHINVFYLLKYTAAGHDLDMSTPQKFLSPIYLGMSTPQIFLYLCTWVHQHHKFCIETPS